MKILVALAEFRDKNIIHIEPAKIFFTDESGRKDVIEFPIGFVLTSREKLHQFIDEFCDRIGK